VGSYINIAAVIFNGSFAWAEVILIRQTPSNKHLMGDYIVAGLSQSDDGDVSGNHGNGDYWIVKTET
jgi:hypothetical protein